MTKASGEEPRGDPEEDDGGSIAGGKPDSSIAHDLERTRTRKKSMPSASDCEAEIEQVVHASR